MIRPATAMLVALGLLVACGGDDEPSTPEGAVSIGPFFVTEDDGLPFDLFPAICETETVDDGTLLAGTPFESRQFPDWTRVHRCKEDGHVTGAVVLSWPGYRRYEFSGPPVIESAVSTGNEFSLIEFEGLPALAEVIPGSVQLGHSTALYVIEQLPDGASPGRMAELCCVGSIPQAMCFMRQMLDRMPPGPCPP